MDASSRAEDIRAKNRGENARPGPPLELPNHVIIGSIQILVNSYQFSDKCKKREIRAVFSRATAVLVSRICMCTLTLEHNRRGLTGRRRDKIRHLSGGNGGFRERNREIVRRE